MRVLIVDDEPTQVRLLESVVTRAGFTAETASGGQMAVDRLCNQGLPKIDVVLLDLMMPDVGGLDVLTQIKPKQPSLPFIVLTGHASVNRVVEAMRAGAGDFLVKPASAERIRAAITAAITADQLVGEIAQVTADLASGEGFGALVGISAATTGVMELARKGARTNIPILLEGESGVGKEMFARAIRQASDRADKPFVTVNCGAIPDNLIESILFGHEKGAFTGATDQHIGKFEEANTGTLFLDEVGELPLDLQVKLLRAIQEGEIDRVGGGEPIKVDIRIISATNRDMDIQVSEGAFREDLYYRLNVFPIRIPPLRDRREDIPALSQHFVRKIAAAESLGVKSLSDDAIVCLRSYDWPGNIRQLQNALFRAIILSESDTLTAEDFHLVTAGVGVTTDVRQGLSPAHPPTAATDMPSSAGIQIWQADGNVKSLAAIEKAAIALALDRYKGQMSEVARQLDIGRSTLYRKVAEYGLDESE